MIVETKLDHLVYPVDLASYQDQVNQIHEGLMAKTGRGNDFLGWLDWPVNYDKAELAQIKASAAYVRAHYDVLVVCGIGGSYLGARAAIEAIRGLFPKDKMQILFLGQTFDPTYVAQCLDYLKDK